MGQESGRPPRILRDLRYFTTACPLELGPFGHRRACGGRGGQGRLGRPKAPSKVTASAIDQPMACRLFHRPTTSTLVPSARPAHLPDGIEICLGARLSMTAPHLADPSAAWHSCGSQGLRPGTAVRPSSWLPSAQIPGVFQPSPAIVQIDGRIENNRPFYARSLMTSGPHRDNSLMA